jgi:hypothetical protein
VALTEIHEMGKLPLVLSRHIGGDALHPLIFDETSTAVPMFFVSICVTDDFRIESWSSRSRFSCSASVQAPLPDAILRPGKPLAVTASLGELIAFVLANG